MNERPNTATQGHKSRYLFLFLLGLTIGIVATVMAVRALHARKDHFPESVMYVQQWHMGQLRTNLEQNRCAATDTVPHLRTLRALADDLEPAFPDLRDDQRYVQHASNMRAAVDGTLASPPMSCQALGAALKSVDDTCRACHQDFRS
ncbi:MAG: hypothetical protein AVDCRST_MAG71-994 [uncultured Lysobacter sp.]|uniref:Cytochrome c n=1 Tax=uncultured Lysobacter sp. TaxID=271060 RepID=A0A6J4KVX4_9GAMM|nr:MAG: hypothetical protein AVDCRST_MAG71-994 [uncultured Lysobacter sp.]